MEVQDVPVEYSRETIQATVTTMMMGMTLFPEDDHSQACGQLFAILVANRLNAEKEGGPVDPEGFLVGFVEHLRETQQHIPAPLLDAFSVLSPEQFDGTYAALQSTFGEGGLQTDELISALMNVSVVMQFFSSQMKPS